jgi:hypothetical protein
MRRDVLAFERSKRGDQLAWLVLRVIAQLSPCTKTSLIAYVAEGDSKRGQTTLSAQRLELILTALLKLKGLAFVRFAQEQIALTDEGKRFLRELPPVGLRPNACSAGKSRRYTTRSTMPCRGNLGPIMSLC